MWRAGEQIVMRYLRGGRVSGVRPLTVAGERDGYVAGWLAPGTPVVVPVLENGSPIRSIPLEQRYDVGRRSVECVWTGGGILKLVPRAGEHSVWLFWAKDGTFRGWYVNLEQRHRFWAGGVDTRDHVLDVWVEPDGSWRWKDEDELAEAARRGRVDAAAVRAEGERVLADPPWPTGWEDWRPDAAWPVPALPERWDALA